MELENNNQSNNIIQKQLTVGFKKIQEDIMHSWIFGDDSSGTFNWKTHFEKDKERMEKLIDVFDNLINNNQPQDNNLISKDIKMFSYLGFIPRDSEFTYPMNCFLYWYIKKHCPQAQTEIQPDGSIFGCIKNENSKNNICLNAHMDLINIDRTNRDRIWYGAYGKTGEFYYEPGKDINQNKLFIKRKNPKTPLGADDGKGIATILNILKNYDKTTMPNLTFFLSSVEENDLYSMKHFIKSEKNIEKLFPKDLKNIAFLNLDAFEGKEIDLYSDQSVEYKDLENKIIQKHKEYVQNNLQEKSTQDKCWTDPMSDAFSIKMWVNRHKLQGKLKDFSQPLLISLAPTSLNPHSNKETIDVIEFGKFQKYIQKDLLPMLNKYVVKKLSQEEIDNLISKEKVNKINKLKKQLKSLQEPVVNTEQVKIK